MGLPVGTPRGIARRRLGGYLAVSVAVFGAGVGLAGVVMFGSWPRRP